MLLISRKYTTITINIFFLCESSQAGWMDGQSQILHTVDFDVGKSKGFGAFLSESINFEYLRH